MWWLVLLFLPLPFAVPRAVDGLYYIIDRYHALREISILNNKSMLRIIWNMCTAYLRRYTNKQSVNIFKKERNLYEVSFELEGKVCKLFVSLHRGPRMEKKYYSENGTDITEYVQPYIHSHFSIHPPTPKLFGNKHIKVVCPERELLVHEADNVR